MDKVVEMIIESYGKIRTNSSSGNDGVHPNLQRTLPKTDSKGEVIEENLEKIRNLVRGYVKTKDFFATRAVLLPKKGW